MTGICQAHRRNPAPIYTGGEACYGELWKCPGCDRDVCAGFGAADDLPGHCDSCWAKHNNNATQEAGIETIS